MKLSELQSSPLWCAAAQGPLTPLEFVPVLQANLVPALLLFLVTFVQEPDRMVGMLEVPQVHCWVCSDSSHFLQASKMFIGANIGNL